MPDTVAILAGQRVVRHWTDYDVTVSLTSPSDSFSLSIGAADRRLHELVAPDTEVQILVDDVPLITGYLDDREWVTNTHGSTLSVSGRDKVGRLIDESAPLVSFVGITLEDLAKKMAAPWFEKVTLSNARNRKLLRGNGDQARASKEPQIPPRKIDQKKTDPGEKRFEVLQMFLEDDSILAWSSGDGKELILSKPNYEQEPQWNFFLASRDSARKKETNVLGATVRHSVGERYSEIVFCGAATRARKKGDDKAKTLNRHRASVTNGPGAQGIGKDFQRPKVLLVANDEVRSADHCLALARREMATRDAEGHSVSLVVPGHGGTSRGSRLLYTPDTMVTFELEDIGLSGLYLISEVGYQRAQGGPATQLTLVPKGTVLAW